MLKWLVKGVGTIAMVGVIFLLLLEISARILDPFGISYYPKTASYLDTMIIEEPIGYRNRPNLDGEFWGAPVSTNSLGLRGEEIDPEPAEDEFRILMLGDSLVFGVGVSDRYTIPQQLERQLNRGADGVAYRVVNMGVPSYNTEQELIQLQTLGLSLNPDLVVLIFTINDLQPKMWVFDRRASTLLNIAQRSYAMSLLALAYWSLSGHEDRVPYLRNGDAHPRWPTVENAVAEIAHLCEANGVPLVLFTHESSPRVEAIAAQIGVPLVDLEPLLEDAREQRPGVALTVSKIDRHPNRAGTEMYSTLLRESLERLDLLPTGKTRADAAGRQDAAPGAAAQ